MALAFMSENDFGTKDIKLDIYRMNEAREWADRMLKMKRKVWIGRYSIRNARWCWTLYTGTLPKRFKDMRD